MQIASRARRWPVFPLLESWHWKPGWARVLLGLVVLGVLFAGCKPSTSRKQVARPAIMIEFTDGVDEWPSVSFQSGDGMPTTSLGPSEGITVAAVGAGPLLDKCIGIRVANQEGEWIEVAVWPLKEDWSSYRVSVDSTVSGVCQFYDVDPAEGAPVPKREISFDAGMSKYCLSDGFQRVPCESDQGHP